MFCKNLKTAVIINVKNFCQSHKNRSTSAVFKKLMIILSILSKFVSFE